MNLGYLMYGLQQIDPKAKVELCLGDGRDIPWLRAVYLKIELVINGTEVGRKLEISRMLDLRATPMELTDIIIDQIGGDLAYYFKQKMKGKL